MAVLMGVFGTIAVSLLQEPLHGSDQSDLADPYVPMIVDVAPAFFMMAASALLLAALGTFEAKNKGMNKHASSHLSNQSPVCVFEPSVRARLAVARQGGVCSGGPRRHTHRGHASDARPSRGHQGGSAQ